MNLFETMEAQNRDLAIPRPGTRPAIVTIERPSLTRRDDGSVDLVGRVAAGLNGDGLSIRTLRVPARLASRLPDTEHDAIDRDVLCRARLDPTDSSIGIVTSIVSDEELMRHEPACQGM